MLHSINAEAKIIPTSTTERFWLASANAREHPTGLLLECVEHESNLHTNHSGSDNDTIRISRHQFMLEYKIKKYNNLIENLAPQKTKPQLRYFQTTDEIL